MKAIALLSGGLDSTLAVRVVLDQVIEVEALNFMTVFCRCTAKGSTCLASQKAARTLGIKLQVRNMTDEFLEVVRPSQIRLWEERKPLLGLSYPHV